MKKLIKSLLILCMVTINISVPTFATAAPYEKFVIVKQGYTFENHRGGAIKISDQYGEKLAIVSDKEKVKYYNDGEENTSLTINQQTELKTVIAVDGEMVLTLEGQQIKKSRNYFWTLRDFNQDLIMAYVTRPAKQSFAINVTKFLKDIDRKTERLIIKKAKKLGLSYVDLKSALESSIDLDTAENNYDRAKLLAAAVNLDVKSVLKFKECQNHIIVNGVEICEDNSSSLISNTQSTNSSNTSEGNPVVDNGGNDDLTESTIGSGYGDLSTFEGVEYLNTGNDFHLRHTQYGYISGLQSKFENKTFHLQDYFAANNQLNTLKGRIADPLVGANFVDKYNYNLSAALSNVQQSGLDYSEFEVFNNGFPQLLGTSVSSILGFMNNIADDLGFSELTTIQQNAVAEYLFHKNELSIITPFADIIAVGEEIVPQAQVILEGHSLETNPSTATYYDGYKEVNQYFNSTMVLQNEVIHESSITTAGFVAKKASIVDDFTALNTDSTISQINEEIGDTIDFNMTSYVTGPYGLDNLADGPTRNAIANQLSANLATNKLVENAGFAVELAESAAIAVNVTVSEIEKAKDQADSYDGNDNGTADIDELASIREAADTAREALANAHSYNSDIPQSIANFNDAQQTLAAAEVAEAQNNLNDATELADKAAE